MNELLQPVEPNTLDDMNIPVEIPAKFNRQQRSQMAARKAEKPHRFRMHADGTGYDVLHPTKGWRRYSPGRIRAEAATLAKRVGQLPWWHGVSALEKVVANG